MPKAAMRLVTFPEVGLALYGHTEGEWKTKLRFEQIGVKHPCGRTYFWSGA